jgi:hypothetical protein
MLPNRFEGEIAHASILIVFGLLRSRPFATVDLVYIHRVHPLASRLCFETRRTTNLARRPATVRQSVVGGAFHPSAGA